MLQNVELNVKGMSCQHCVMSVKKAVGELEGVKNVDVNLQEGKVRVEVDAAGATFDEIKEAIEDAGYDVE